MVVLYEEMWKQTGTPAIITTKRIYIDDYVMTAEIINYD